MTVLVQLFSGRNFTRWPEVLDKIKQYGYAGVEGYAAVYADPPAFRALLDQRQLVMPTAHFAVSALEQDFSASLQTARTLGVELIIAPYLPPESRPVSQAEWRAFARRLDALDAKVRDAGLDFAWHNHEFELQATDGGVFPMDLLLDIAPNLAWEADLGWIHRAGHDPLKWLDERKDRIVSLHLKDNQANWNVAAENGWADLGQGENDWRAVFSVMKTIKNIKYHVAEHDHPADFERFLKRWMQGYQALAAAQTA